MNALNSRSIESKEKWLVIGIIGVYLLLCVLWEFFTDAPWDDDCVVRYYNAKGAIEEPKHFINLWNRPLFILLFFLPFQISKHTILLMAVISSTGAYALYKAAKKLEVPNAYLVVPMLLFQAFFFIISKSALAEPLAAAIISLSYLCYLNKKFLCFAILGSLLPLARLEMSVLLVVWVYILIANKSWKYIFVLAIPTVIWSVAGTIIEGGTIWIYDKTLGKDNETNRYGHTDFWHYFQRYIYVVGPAVFYFFFIGFIEKLYKRKFKFFPLVLFIIGFGTYVIFSWKLNLGQAAGFLRHLIVLSPLTAIISLYGFNYWLQSIGKIPDDISLNKKKDNLPNEKNLQEKIKEIRAQGKEKNLKERQIRYLVNAEKKKFEERKSQTVKKIKSNEHKLKKQSRGKKIRILLYSFILIGLTLLFFSKKLRSHHKITDIEDYTNLLIISAFTLIFISLTFLFRKKVIINTIKFGLTFLVTAVIMSYTLITEPPDVCNSPERKTMGHISNLYLESYLKNYDCYVNHSWFFWVNDLERDTLTYRIITQRNLDQAPDSSIILWENHYSHRLAGDVQLNYFKNNPKFIELFRNVSSDNKFIGIVFQKIETSEPQEVVKVYDRFIEFRPDISSAYVNRANVKFNKLKNFEEAIIDYDRALKIDSNYIDAIFNKGSACFNLKQHEKAIELFKKAIKLKPTYYQAYYNIGMSMFALGDSSNAILNYSKVIKLKPDFHQAYFNRAIIYTLQKEFEKAITDYEKIIALEPKNIAYAYYNKGLIHLQLGQHEAGCKDLQKSIELGHPNANIVQHYCGKYR